MSWGKQEAEAVAEEPFAEQPSTKSTEEPEKKQRSSWFGGDSDEEKVLKEDKAEESPTTLA